MNFVRMPLIRDFTPIDTPNDGNRKASKEIWRLVPGRWASFSKEPGAGHRDELVAITLVDDL